MCCNLKILTVFFVLQPLSQSPLKIYPTSPPSPETHMMEENSTHTTYSNSKKPDILIPGIEFPVMKLSFELSWVVLYGK